MQLNTVSLTVSETVRNVCRCSGVQGEYQALTLCGLERRSEGSERMGKSVYFFFNCVQINTFT